jgi:hypothetical protein
VPDWHLPLFLTLPGKHYSGATIPAATRAGSPVILPDDFDRENEADLMAATDELTNETMAPMILECSGIVTNGASAPFFFPDLAVLPRRHWSV